MRGHFILYGPKPERVLATSPSRSASQAAAKSPKRLRKDLLRFLPFEEAPSSRSAAQVQHEKHVMGTPQQDEQISSNSLRHIISHLKILQSLRCRVHAVRKGHEGSRDIPVPRRCVNATLRVVQLGNTDFQFAHQRRDFFRLRHVVDTLQTVV
jgi:hypothetical protein